MLGALRKFWLKIHPDGRIIQSFLFLCILPDGLAEAKIRAPSTRPPYRQVGFPAELEGCKRNSSLITKSFTFGLNSYRICATLVAN